MQPLDPTLGDCAAVCVTGIGTGNRHEVDIFLTSCRKVRSGVGWRPGTYLTPPLLRQAMACDFDAKTTWPKRRTNFVVRPGFAKPLKLMAPQPGVGFPLNVAHAGHVCRVVFADRWRCRPAMAMPDRTLMVPAQTPGSILSLILSTRSCPANLPRVEFDLSQTL
jgi:hypothetical protein